MRKTRQQKINSRMSPLEVELKKGVQLLEKKYYKDALTCFESVLKKDSKHYLAQMNKGLCHFYLDEFTKAIEVFHQVHTDNPEDLKALYHCGVNFGRIGSFEIALKFLKRYLQKDPEDFYTLMEITSVTTKLEMYEESLMYATKALSIQPMNASSYNNLGVALLGIQKMKEAEQAFLTALALNNNDCVVAMSNIATVADSRGDFSRAVDLYDKLLQKIDHNSYFGQELLYRSSYPYLATGQLKEGWRRYDFGFSPNNNTSRWPKLKLSIPQWSGEDIVDKKIVVWGEQGIGDEIWFFGWLGELSKRCKNISVVCEPRLVTLLQRAFKHMHVEASVPGSDYSDKFLDHDFHIPSGSMMGIFCNDIDDLENYNPYIIPDKKLVDNLSNRLKQTAETKGNTIIGICWRSGKVDAQRIQGYLTLFQMSPILKEKGVTFVNLQYGDCEKEIAQVELELGIRIHRWDDIDLKDDQESLAALISCTDMVISAGTAVASLAGALGKETLLFTHYGFPFLGEKNYPWSKKTKAFTLKNGEDLEGLVPLMAAHVRSEVKKETVNP